MDEETKFWIMLRVLQKHKIDKFHFHKRNGHINHSFNNVI